MIREESESASEGKESEELLLSASELASEKSEKLVSEESLLFVYPAPPDTAIPMAVALIEDVIPRPMGPPGDGIPQPVHATWEVSKHSAGNRFRIQLLPRLIWNPHISGAPERAKVNHIRPPTSPSFEWGRPGMMVSS